MTASDINGFPHSIDIGSCVTKENDILSRLYCLNGDKLNFCCQQTDVTILIGDTGARTCCSLENYSDQHWVSLAVIRGYSILLVPIFVFLLLVLAWFYSTTSRIRQSTVQRSRRYIMNQLLKHQILHKSKRSHIEPSIVHGLRDISRGLNSSQESEYRNRHAK